MLKVWECEWLFQFPHVVLLEVAFLGTASAIFNFGGLHTAFPPHQLCTNTPLSLILSAVLLAVLIGDTGFVMSRMLVLLVGAFRDSVSLCCLG